MSTAERRTESPFPPGFTPEEWAEILEERARIRAELAEWYKSRPPAPKQIADVEGRPLPMSVEDSAERARKIRAMFERFRSMPDDDPPGADEEFMRSIDENRRRAGMRTVFDGYY
jgi:hypothetical protein